MHHGDNPDKYKQCLRSAGGIAQRAPRSLWSDARPFAAEQAAVAALLYISFLIVVAIIAPLLALHNLPDIFQNNSYRQAALITVPIALKPQVAGFHSAPMRSVVMFGADWYGTRTTLVIGFCANGIYLVPGTVIGLVSGFLAVPSMPFDVFRRDRLFLPRRSCSSL
ncbi:MAG: hypothetical protein U0074_02840 [Kouleothrix sp.]